MRERREKERAEEREVHGERVQRESVQGERVCVQGDTGLKVRCGGRRRGSRVA